MDKLFQNKWAIRVMALIFAVALYLFVGIEGSDTAKSDSPVIPSPDDNNELQVLDDIPLEVKIEDDEVVSGVPEDVTVSLEGKPRVLTPVVKQRNFKVFVDLRELPEGEHTVEVEHNGIPEDLKVYIEPKSVDVAIEKRASEEFSVDVDVVNLDKLPVGYELGEPEVNPETVTIVSSDDVIGQIAMVKVFIDGTDLTESIKSREVPVTVYDSQGNTLNVRVEPENVAVSLSVDRSSKKVPLNVETGGELPDGFSLKKIESEKEIEIFGKQETLEDIKNVTTETIDLSEIDESGEYETEIALPEDVTAEKKKVPVHIELEEKQEFKDISLELVGATEDEITFEIPEDGTVDITATGSDDVVDTLKKEEVKASIKLSDRDKGKHRVDVNIDGPEGMTYTSDPDKVTVERE